MPAPQHKLPLFFCAVLFGAVSFSTARSAVIQPGAFVCVCDRRVLHFSVFAVNRVAFPVSGSAVAAARAHGANTASQCGYYYEVLHSCKC